MGDSESDSDCFQSADENLSEDEYLSSKKINDLASTFVKRESSECNEISEANNPAELSKTEENRPSTSDVSDYMNCTGYRKRSERRIKSLITTKAVSMDSRNSKNETISSTVTNRPDALLQDLTSQLTKNLNLSFTTIQQKSSSLRGMVLNSLPISSKSSENEVTFSYDDYNNGDATIEEDNCFNSDITSDKVEGTSEQVQPAVTTLSDMILSLSHEFGVLQKVLENTSAMENPDNANSNVLSTDDENNEKEEICLKEYKDSNNMSLKLQSMNANEASINVSFEKRNNDWTVQEEISDGNASNNEEDLKVIKDFQETIDTTSTESNKNNNSGDEHSIILTNIYAGKNSGSDQKISVKSKDKNTVISKNDLEKPERKEENADNNKNINEIKTKEKEEEVEEEIKDNDLPHKSSFQPSDQQKTGNTYEETAEEIFYVKGEMVRKQNSKDINEELTAEYIINHSNTEAVESGEENFKMRGECGGQNDGWDDFDIDININEEHSPGSSVISSAADQESKPENLSDVFDEIVQKHDGNVLYENSEGWDDFDFDDDELITLSKKIITDNTKKVTMLKASDMNEVKDDCCGWGTVCTDNVQNTFKGEKNIIKEDTKWSKREEVEESVQEMKAQPWPLGRWGVGALLNTASAVTNNISAVTQGLSSVLEAGLGAPDPETMARIKISEKGVQDSIPDDEKCMKSTQKSSHRNMSELGPKSHEICSTSELESNQNKFPSFGITTLVAGVTSKIVDHSIVQELGTKVISSGLDTLENIGRKTMEVLQEGDPGLKKKKLFILGNDKPVLSHILKEAKEKAEKENRLIEEKQAERKCHFETLFDDFQGMVHLEALEMLSTQCELKLDQMQASMNIEEVEDFKGILAEVKQLCEIDEEEFNLGSSTMVDFKRSILKAVQPLKDEVSVQKIIELHDHVNEWLKNDSDYTSQIIYQKAISTLAEFTAAITHQFHKVAEVLTVKECRKTVEEADSLLQLTCYLCCETNSFSEKFVILLFNGGKLKGGSGDSDVNTMATNINVEAQNAISYIKQAFCLLIPIIQLGAT